MNRPNLPPLRVAVAQFNDPEVLEPPRDHVKRVIQNRIGCSNRLHSDLSFYSLASSSSQFNSSSNGLMLPNSHLLSSRHIDNAGYSSIPPSSNYSKRRSCSDMNQTSGNRHDYMDIKSNQRHEPWARSERSNPPEINSWQQSSSKFSESYRTTQSDLPWRCLDIPQADSMQDHHSACSNHSRSKSHIYCQSQIEVGRNSHSAYSQSHSNITNENPKLGENRSSWTIPESQQTQGDPELFPRSKARPTETASGTRYFCPVGGCGKSFTRNFNLTQHISAIHNDERRFQCT
jgi:hypothetical protein